MKSIHRFLGLFLVICLFAAILPSPVFADNVTGSGYCGGGGKWRQHRLDAGQQRYSYDFRQRPNEKLFQQ